MDTTVEHDHERRGAHSVQRARRATERCTESAHWERTDHWVQVAAALASVAPLSLLFAGRGGEEEEQGPVAQAPALPHNTSQ